MPHGDTFPFGPHVHDAPVDLAGVQRLRGIVRVQLVAVRRGDPVPCASCGRDLAHFYLFRCFHCGIYVCGAQGCAERHFGPRPPDTVSADQGAEHGG